jgi:ABC-type polysaccharide/polyol phosphate export permease
MTDAVVTDRDGHERRHDERVLVSPVPGNPFAVAISDIVEAFQVSSVWLHTGWINVIWRFRRTKLGTFWHTLGLAGFIVTMSVIWSAVLDQDMASYFKFLTVNLILWTFIASFISEGTGTLLGGQATILSMRFPYFAFAFGHAWRTVLVFAHHFVLYLLMLAITMTNPGWAVLYAIPAFAIIVANGVWVSMLLGILSLRWRDIAPATATAMQVLMLITPVFWPKEMLGPEFAFAADLNPLFHFMQVARDPLLGVTPPLISWLWVLGTLVVGWIVTLWVYGRYRNRMAYWF